MTRLALTFLVGVFLFVAGGTGGAWAVTFKVAPVNLNKAKQEPNSIFKRVSSDDQLIYEFSAVKFDKKCQAKYQPKVSQEKLGKSGIYTQVLRYPGGSASIITSFKNGEVTTKIRGGNIHSVKTETEVLENPSLLKIKVSLKHSEGKCHYFYQARLKQDNISGSNAALKEGQTNSDASEENTTSSDLEKQRKAEEEQQRLAELEKQRKAEEEQQRLAELEKQRKAEEERQRLAELEKQRKAEEEQERLAELEKQRKAEEKRQRLAELEKQRKAEEEQERLAELEKQRKAEEEQERLAELEKQRKAEEEQQRLVKETKLKGLFARAKAEGLLSDIEEYVPISSDFDVVALMELFSPVELAFLNNNWTQKNLDALAKLENFISKNQNFIIFHEEKRKEAQFILKSKSENILGRLRAFLRDNFGKASFKKASEFTKSIETLLGKNPIIYSEIAKQLNLADEFLLENSDIRVELAQGPSNVVTLDLDSFSRQWNKTSSVELIDKWLGKQVTVAVKLLNLEMPSDNEIWLRYASSKESLFAGNNVLLKLDKINENSLFSRFNFNFDAVSKEFKNSAWLTRKGTMGNIVGMIEEIDGNGTIILRCCDGLKKIVF